MKPVNQTVRGEYGNCFAACMASILERSIDEMPDHFAIADISQWLMVWREWLKRLGLGIVWMPNTGSNQTPPGYSICATKTKDPETTHAVVCFDGQVMHDPLPEPGELGEADHWYVLTVLDAAQVTTA